MKGRPSGRALQIAVGVANAVPKLIAYRLLRPVVDGPEAVHLTCREDHPDQLVAQLAVHALDVVISDSPAAPHVRVKVFDHLLAESGRPSSPQSGRAVFPTPTVIEREVCRRYRVAVVGRVPSVRERYYAISIERRLKHPGVVAIAATARTELSPK